MVKWLRNAFAVEPPGSLRPTDEERRLIDQLVERIVRRGLSAPALLLLACNRPLNFIGGQLLLFVAPAAEVLFPKQSYRTLANFLQRRGSIEYFCRQIERRTASDEQSQARSPSSSQTTMEEER